MSTITTPSTNRVLVLRFKAVSLSYTNLNSATTRNTASAAASPIQILRRKRVRPKSVVSRMRAMIISAGIGAEAGAVAVGAACSKVVVGADSVAASGRKTFGVLISEDQSRICRLTSAPNAGTGCEVNGSGGSFSGAIRSRMLPSKESHQPCAKSSPRSSPTSTGLDSSCSGGRVSGEITSPRLLKTVRYQGSSNRSPGRMPTSTGFEVSSSGGKRSGATRSMKFRSSERHKGRSKPSGGERSRSTIQFPVGTLMLQACGRDVLLYRVVSRNLKQRRIGLATNNVHQLYCTVSCLTVVGFGQHCHLQVGRNPSVGDADNCLVIAHCTCVDGSRSSRSGGANTFDDLGPKRHDRRARGIGEGRRVHRGSSVRCLNWMSCRQASLSAGHLRHAERVGWPASDPRLSAHADSVLVLRFRLLR